MVDEIDNRLLEVFELRQNLDGPVHCDVSKWRTAEYQPRGYLKNFAKDSGASQVGLSRFSSSFTALENVTSLGSKKIHRSEVLALGAMYRKGEVGV